MLATIIINLFLCGLLLGAFGLLFIAWLNRRDHESESIAYRKSFSNDFQTILAMQNAMANNMHIPVPQLNHSDNDYDDDIDVQQLVANQNK